MEIVLSGRLRYSKRQAVATAAMLLETLAVAVGRGVDTAQAEHPLTEVVRRAGRFLRAATAATAVAVVRANVEKLLRFQTEAEAVEVAPAAPAGLGVAIVASTVRAIAAAPLALVATAMGREAEGKAAAVAEQAAPVVALEGMGLAQLLATHEAAEMATAALRYTRGRRSVPRKMLRSLHPN